MAITKIGTTGILNNLDVPGYLYLSGDEKELRFYEGANYVAIKTNSSLAGNYTLTLPLNDGASSEFLQTNGSGVLIWAAAGGGNAFTNDVTVTSGNFVMGTADKGIDFAVTGNSSGTMQSEVLDDYEEGIFSPTMLFAGANTGISYTEQSGTYTKIGDRVIYSIRLRVANKGSSTGSLQIGGFPFAVGTGTRNYTAHTLYWDKIACTGTLIGYNAVGASYLDIRTVNDSGTNADVTDSGVTNGLTFHIAGTYSVRNIA